ncbi:hypothetical protein BVI1335_1530016 [Burkholderia vietnamiensis]|nr:hypothetical protein BVI1335_1530016 [Burkholderia vietnamiensis]
MPETLAQLLPRRTVRRRSRQPRRDGQGRGDRAVSAKRDRRGEPLRRHGRRSGDRHVTPRDARMRAGVLRAAAVAGSARVVHEARPRNLADRRSPRPRAAGRTAAGRRTRFRDRLRPRLSSAASRPAMGIGPLRHLRVSDRFAQARTVDARLARRILRHGARVPHAVGIRAQHDRRLARKARPLAQYRRARQHVSGLPEHRRAAAGRADAAAAPDPAPVDSGERTDLRSAPRLPDLHAGRDLVDADGEEPRHPHHAQPLQGSRERQRVRAGGVASRLAAIGSRRPASGAGYCQWGSKAGLPFRNLNKIHIHHLIFKTVRPAVSVD